MLLPFSTIVVAIAVCVIFHGTRMTMVGWRSLFSQHRYSHWATGEALVPPPTTKRRRSSCSWWRGHEELNDEAACSLHRDRGSTLVPAGQTPCGCGPSWRRQWELGDVSQRQFIGFLGQIVCHSKHHLLVVPVDHLCLCVIHPQPLIRVAVGELGLLDPGFVVEVECVLMGFWCEWDWACEGEGRRRAGLRNFTSLMPLLVLLYVCMYYLLLNADWLIGWLIESSGNNGNPARTVQQAMAIAK